VRELTEAEEQRLFAVLNERYHDVVYFTIRTGLRLSECVNLTWDKIDWGTRTIRVFGKGDKEALVPLPVDVRDRLWKNRNHHPERVFSWSHGDDWHPFTTSGLDSALGRAVAKAKIPDFHFHDLRHTAATRLLRKSGNLVAVQKLLRHEDIKTTRRYAHVNDNDLRRLLDDMVQGVTTVVTTVKGKGATNARN